VAFVAGYVKQDFGLTFNIWCVGAVLAFVLTVPAWPFLFHRNPVAWQKAEA
jgi:hypothetical protein